MPKLCEIVKPGVACRVISPGGTLLDWEGHLLSSPETREGWRVGINVLFSNDWKSAEPTVESILKERGYVYQPLGDRNGGPRLIKATNVNKGMGVPWLNCPMPQTTAEATRIIDFLESLPKE